LHSTNEDRKLRVGVVGLGNMGLPMAERLAAAGFAVAGADPSPARRALLAGACGSAAELAAACDVLLLSLPGAREVAAVLDGAAGALRPGMLVIDTSTVDPGSTRGLQAALAARGIGFVDAPVSGGAAGAVAGQLLVMLGGAEGDVARAEAVLAPLARKIVRCGGPGAGNVVKLLNNQLAAAHLVLAGEALGLADAAGVAPEALLEALNAGSGRSAVTEVNLPRWILSGTFDSGFTMALMRKDMKLAGGLADAAGRPGGLSAAARDAWARSADALDGPADFNRMAEWTRAKPR